MQSLPGMPRTTRGFKKMNHAILSISLRALTRPPSQTWHSMGLEHSQTWNYHVLTHHTDLTSRMMTRRHSCRDSQSHELLSLHHREPGRLSPSHRPVPTLLSRPVQGPSKPSGEETDLFQPEGSSITPERLPASYPTQYLISMSVFPPMSSWPLPLPT